MAIVPWVTDMHKITLPHYWTEHVNGVTVFRILIKEVSDPDTAVAVFRASRRWPGGWYRHSS